MPLYKATPIKSSIRTEWDQSVENIITSNSNVYWDNAPTFNNGSMFTYIYDAEGYTQIQINKTGVALISLSLGSEGPNWDALTLMTVLLNEQNAGVVDVFYELPVPDNGSLYPTSSTIIRQVIEGEKYNILVNPSGADIGYSDINTLSAWAFAEI